MSPVCHETPPQLLMILDDAVVHHRYRANLVGVGIANGRPAMRRPACVPDPHVAVQSLHREEGLEVGEFAEGAHHPGSRSIRHRQSRGVVAPILQTPKAVHQNGRSFARPNIANYPAHFATSFMFFDVMVTPLPVVIYGYGG